MKFSIMLTEDCNLRCKYCYEGNNKIKNKLDKYTADKVINFILECLKKELDNEILYIVFHGGEPLMNFETMKYIHHLLNNKVKDRKIIYDMTTNGTIINEEIKNFLKDNIDNVSISIDGTKESHDSNRVFEDGRGSYDLVIKNAKILIDSGISLRCRMTFNTKNIHELYESVVSMDGLGFKYIVPVIDSYDNWDKTHMDIYSKELEKLVSNKNINSKNNISMLDTKLINIQKGDCFGGINSFCIDTKGFIYPCTLAVNKKEFIIGNVYDDSRALNKEKIEEFCKIYVSQNEKCTGCTRYDYCIGVRCKILNKLITNEYTNPPCIVCFEEHMKFKTAKLLLQGNII